MVSLFLLGVRYRKQADDLLRGSLAAANIVEEIRMVPVTAPQAPSKYLGTGIPGQGDSAGQLYPYAGIPGIWYRVQSSVDAVTGTDDATATAIRLRLLVVTADAVAAEELTLEDLNNQLRIVDRGSPPDAIADAFIKRGIAIDYPATLVRRPHWLP